jgi:hypothetical protein
MKRSIVISVIGVVLCLHLNAQNSVKSNYQETSFFEALFRLDINRAEKILKEIEPLDQTAYVIGSVQLQWWDAVSSGQPVSAIIKYIDSTENLFPNYLPILTCIFQVCD